MSVCDCPHCKTGTKGVVIAAHTGRITFRFPESLASCACEITVMERLQMVVTAAQEAVSEIKQVRAS